MACILLIDDDPVIRIIFRQALEGAGYEVIEAGNGREGIQCYKARPVDLVVTDIVMPEQDGLETIKVLQTLAPAVPIIALSAGGYREGLYVLQMARRLGAHRTLQKPVALWEFLATVRDLLTEP